MLFSIYINQKAAIEWGLNLNQAAVFSVIYAAAAWADKDGDYWNISKGKIIKELPLLTDKPDTIYRLQRELLKKELIEKKVVESKDFFRITRKGMVWALDESAVNQEAETSGVDDSSGVVESRKNIRASENNPNGDIFLSDDRKNIRDNSENNPSYLGKKSDVLNNQDYITNINITTSCSKSGEEMTMDWWPPDDIYKLCQQLTRFTDEEFSYVVADYRVFWLSDDGVRREKPRSWGNHFKNSFVRALYRIRQSRGMLVRKSRDIPIEKQLLDRSWAE